MRGKFVLIITYTFAAPSSRADWCLKTIQMVSQLLLIETRKYVHAHYPKRFSFWIDFLFRRHHASELQCFRINIKLLLRHLCLAIGHVAVPHVALLEIITYVTVAPTVDLVA
jgi:hypothetical protein